MATANRRCPDCAEELPEQARYCACCGYELGGGKAPPPPLLADRSAASMSTAGMRCTDCGERMPEQARFCPSCGAEYGAGMKIRSRPADDMGENAGIRMLLPVGRSGWAIASGYLGLISVLMVPAPFALLTGILAIGDIRRNPKKHGLGRAWFGIIMGVFGTVGLIGALISYYANPRR